MTFLLHQTFISTVSWRVGLTPCHKTLKVSRTLLLVSLWGRGLPEEEFRGAESTPEFLIFNDEVIGCEILDWSGRRWAVLRSTTGALGGLLKRRRAHRGPSAALWNLPGFYNGLYLPRCQRNPHRLSPSQAPASHNVFTYRCVLVSQFFLKCLQDCWMPYCHQKCWLL